MDIKLTTTEINILDKADNDFGIYGKTNEKCPRCGSDIVVEEKGKSYLVRCKNDNCISMSIRGI